MTTKTKPSSTPATLPRTFDIKTAPTAEPQTAADARLLITERGLDPELYDLDFAFQSKQVRDKETGDVVTLHSQTAKAKLRYGTSLDLPALYAEARRRPAAPFKRAAAAPERATVVNPADEQVGKTGSRGGTPELLERLAEKRDALDKLLRQRRPSRTVLTKAGDGFEGFDAGGNPMFTNDRSLAVQMDIHGAETLKDVELLARYGHVDVLAVPSNHTAWRNGKQSLGNAQDDLGLYVYRQVQKIVEAKGLDVEFHYPAPYDESVAVDILGTTLGLAHGHQYGPGGAIGWWEKQTFGAQAVTPADVLVTGHYHHFAMATAGRNPASGRQRWWMQMPTLDNGSDHYRLRAGRDSDAGLVVFDIDAERGFSPDSLVIL